MCVFVCMCVSELNCVKIKLYVNKAICKKMYVNKTYVNKIVYK